MTDLDSLLEELYRIDPSLRDHDADSIKAIVADLLKSKPDVTPDKRFVAELRRTLGARAAELKGPTTDSFTHFFSTLFMPKFSYAVIGTVFSILIAVPAVHYVVTQNSAPGAELAIDGGNERQPVFSYTVTDAGEEAFGSLGTIATQPPQAPVSMAAERSARTQSGGGDGMDVKIASPSMDMMIYPPMPRTKYVYNGELPLTDATVQVLKRQKNITSSPALASFLSSNLGLVDLGSFPGSKVESFNIYQDRNEGYYINVNLKEGMISINQNWEAWPQPNCQDQACWDRQRIRGNELPSSDEAISIADAFLKGHGITMPNLGTPFMDEQWRQSYETMENKADYWFPETVSVIYPLEIEGQPVHEEYGYRVGLNVSVGVRSKKVTGIWNLMDQQFSRSSYAGVTDSRKVLDFIASYNNFGYMQAGIEGQSELKEQVIELGTPTRGYARVYRYENNASDELYVPALIFPVQAGAAAAGSDDPAAARLAYMNQPYVIVPLAAELLNRQRPQIMPLMKGIDDPAATEPVPTDADLPVSEPAAR